MDILAKLLQRVVYWEPPTRNYKNNLTFSEPTEMWGRWEDKIELFVDPMGRTVPSRSFVFTQYPTKVEGWLMLGELTDVPSGVDDPREIKEAFEIRRSDDLPDLRNEEHLYTAILS